MHQGVGTIAPHLGIKIFVLNKLFDRILLCNTQNVVDAFARAYYVLMRMVGKLAMGYFTAHQTEHPLEGDCHSTTKSKQLGDSRANLQ